MDDTTHPTSWEDPKRNRIRTLLGEEQSVWQDDLSR